MQQISAIQQAAAAAAEEEETADEEEDEHHQPDDTEPLTEDTDDGNTKPDEEPMEIKEQMYQDKLATLKKQLQQLENHTHPEYNRKLKKLEHAHKERLKLNEVWQQIEADLIEREYVKEKKAAIKEFEEKKIELKETLLTDLEEKKKFIEVERMAIELTGDSMEVKPVTTRKLRRRPNDPIPQPEKRRKPALQTLNYLLQDDDIDADLKLITTVNETETPAVESSPPSNEIKIEDGKLFYERKWFHRGQPIFIEGKEITKYSAVIALITPDSVVIRKTVDNSKVRIHLTQLQKNKYILRRRPS